MSSLDTYLMNGNYKCSRDCLDKFEKDTELFLKNEDHSRPHHAGGVL